MRWALRLEVTGALAALALHEDCAVSGGGNALLRDATGTDGTARLSRARNATGVAETLFVASACKPGVAEEAVGENREHLGSLLRARLAGGNCWRSFGGHRRRTTASDD